MGAGRPVMNIRVHGADILHHLEGSHLARRRCGGCFRYYRTRTIYSVDMY